jgi:nucleoside-diphosphate-sugar epimerase
LFLFLFLLLILCDLLSVTMASHKLPVRDSGIYHNLPQFDPSIQGLSAIITGANGISGFGTLRALLDSPQRWSKIYTISRSPLPAEMMSLLDPNVLDKIEFISCDFLSSPETIAKALKAAKVDVGYIFYYSYLQPRPEPGATAWSNDEELVKVNAGMLSNFLEALPQANIKPKRFLLQTGAKNYGCHLGPALEPCIESDPQPRHLSPNFYYPQEDMLFEYCHKNSVGWNVIRPAWIIGAVVAAAMNPILPFAIYAAVQVERGLPLSFPGTTDNWNTLDHHSSAFLTGYLTEWAALEDKCANQAFNSQDTSPVTWARFWEDLVHWYGVKDGSKPPTVDQSVAFEFSSGKDEKTPLG